MQDLKLQQQQKERPVKNNSIDTIEFSNGNMLVIKKSSKNETIQLVNKRGEINLMIEMTESGSKINLSGDNICFKANEKFEVESPEILFKATQNFNIESEGDFHQKVKRDSFNSARIQYLKAELGNVNIKANDDVRLDGERVKLNCTD